MQENMDHKNHGDAAFRAKDYDTGIEFYTEVNLKKKSNTSSFSVCLIRTIKDLILIYKWTHDHTVIDSIYSSAVHVWSS